MAVKIFLRDNTDGTVHEYGDDSRHDALDLNPDGSLHYINLQNCTGTRFPEEGYSFCDKDGNTDFECPETGESIYDIGGFKTPTFGTWTPTTERLPDDLTFVLATVRNAKKPRILCQRTENGITHWFSTSGKWEQRNVTAWMPLPEPYREAGDAE